MRAFRKAVEYKWRGLTMNKGGAGVRFGFVILHYMAYEMTEKCVLTLLRHFEDYNIKIVVVDNASPNGSGKALMDRFQKEDKVEILFNSVNEGFARGNNCGYDYLVEQYNPDYMIVMNNDVLIEQENFLTQIDVIFRNTSFAVLGPDIYCPLTGKHQSPVRTRCFTADELDIRYRRMALESKYPLLYYIRNNLRDRIRPTQMKTDCTRMQDGIMLHGACYIFSRIFMRQRSYCFFPETFLYAEEDILYVECLRDGLKTVYSPEIMVKHLEDVSTNAATKSDFEKFKMKKKEICNSLSILIEMIKKTEPEK